MGTKTDLNKQKSSLLERLGMGILAEFAFWIFAGLLWLAFTGGIWGIVVAVFFAGCMLFLLWDFQNGKNPNPSSEHND